MRLRNSLLLRVAALAVVAATGGACSILPDMPSVPDWVDPTTWFGDDSSSDNAKTPDLANLPDKPAASTPDQQRDVTDALAADRANAKYSADTLRGGTEAAAAPPPVVAPQVASEEEAPSASSHASAPAPAPAPAPVQVASVDRSVAQEPAGAAMAGTLPPTAAGYAAAEPPPEPVQTASLPPPPAPEATQPAAAPQAAPAAVTEAAPAAATEAAPAAATSPRKHHHPAAATAMASVEPMNTPPVGAQPAVPPMGPTPQQTASLAPSDAALGFKPSTAPPLDPTVSQFVAAPLIQHYRETAANAGLAYATPPSAVASNQPVPRKLHRPARAVAEGGPETMSGAVVANLGVLTPTTAPTAALPTVYANPQGLPAAAVVFFPADAVSLNAEARSQVQAVVEQYRSHGSQGFIRVVGHSSSRTADMSPERHMEIIFRKSQDRANAVAQEIIREGVPAANVLVEAVGDSQPVYYESMPKGEEGNRRAEIFLQS